FFERQRMLVIAFHMDVKELELAVIDAGGPHTVNQDRVHSGHYPLGSKRQERASGHWMGLQAEIKILAHKVSGRVQVLNSIKIDRESFPQKFAEHFGMTPLRIGSSAFFPEVLRKARTMIVVIAVGHNGCYVTGEVPRVQAVLREDKLKILNRQKPSSAGSKQPVVPKLMPRLHLMKLLQPPGP